MMTGGGKPRQSCAGGVSGKRQAEHAEWRDTTTESPRRGQEAEARTEVRGENQVGLSRVY